MICYHSIVALDKSNKIFLLNTRHQEMYDGCMRLRDKGFDSLLLRAHQLVSCSAFDMKYFGG